MTIATDALNMTCPEWCTSGRPTSPGHEDHRSGLDAVIYDGRAGDGRLHWPHHGPRMEDRRVHLYADTFPHDPTEYYVELADIDDKPINDPREARLLAHSLLVAAEWLEEVQR